MGGRKKSSTTNSSLPVGDGTTSEISGGAATVVQQNSNTGGAAAGASNKSQKSGSQMTQQYYKTRMCPFLAKGNCRKGKQCTYAHSDAELRKLPNLQKTKLCEEWQKGKCTDGDNCTFAHGRQELRHTHNFYKTRLCHFWKMAGDCNKGSLCRHAHGAEELRLPEPIAAGTLDGIDGVSDCCEFLSEADFDSASTDGTMAASSTYSALPEAVAGSESDTPASLADAASPVGGVVDSLLKPSLSSAFINQMDSKTRPSASAAAGNYRTEIEFSGDRQSPTMRQQARSANAGQMPHSSSWNCLSSTDSGAHPSFVGGERYGPPSHLGRREFRSSSGNNSGSATGSTTSTTILQQPLAASAATGNDLWGLQRGGAQWPAGGSPSPSFRKDSTHFQSPGSLANFQASGNVANFQSSGMQQSPTGSSATAALTQLQLMQQHLLGDAALGGMGSGVSRAVASPTFRPKPGAAVPPLSSRTRNTLLRHRPDEEQRFQFHQQQVDGLLTAADSFYENASFYAAAGVGGGRSRGGAGHAFSSLPTSSGYLPSVSSVPDLTALAAIGQEAVEGRMASSFCGPLDLLPPESLSRYRDSDFSLDGTHVVRGRDHSSGFLLQQQQHLPPLSRKSPSQRALAAGAIGTKTTKPSIYPVASLPCMLPPEYFTGGAQPSLSLGSPELRAAASGLVRTRQAVAAGLSGCESSSPSVASNTPSAATPPMTRHHHTNTASSVNLATELAPLVKLLQEAAPDLNLSAAFRELLQQVAPLQESAKTTAPSTAPLPPALGPAQIQSAVSVPAVSVAPSNQLNRALQTSQQLESLTSTLEDQDIAVLAAWLNNTSKVHDYQLPPGVQRFLSDRMEHQPTDSLASSSTSSSSRPPHPPHGDRSSRELLMKRDGDPLPHSLVPSGDSDADKNLILLSASGGEKRDGSAAAADVGVNHRGGRPPTSASTSPTRHSLVSDHLLQRSAGRSSLPYDSSTPSEPDVVPPPIYGMGGGDMYRQRLLSATVTPTSVPPVLRGVPYSRSAHALSSLVYPDDGTYAHNSNMGVSSRDCNYSPPTPGRAGFDAPSRDMPVGGAARPTSHWSASCQSIASLVDLSTPDDEVPSSAASPRRTTGPTEDMHHWTTPFSSSNPNGVRNRKQTDDDSQSSVPLSSTADVIKPSSRFHKLYMSDETTLDRKLNELPQLDKVRLLAFHEALQQEHLKHCRVRLGASEASTTSESSAAAVASTNLRGVRSRGHSTGVVEIANNNNSSAPTGNALQQDYHSPTTTRGNSTQATSYWPDAHRWTDDSMGPSDGRRRFSRHLEVPHEAIPLAPNTGAAAASVSPRSGLHAFEILQDGQGSPERSSFGNSGLSGFDRTPRALGHGRSFSTHSDIATGLACRSSASYPQLWDLLNGLGSEELLPDGLSTSPSRASITRGPSPPRLSMEDTSCSTHVSAAAHFPHSAAVPKSSGEAGSSGMSPPQDVLHSRKQILSASSGMQITLEDSPDENLEADELLSHLRAEEFGESELRNCRSLPNFMLADPMAPDAVLALTVGSHVGAGLLSGGGSGMLSANSPSSTCGTSPPLPRHPVPSPVLTLSRSQYADVFGSSIENITTAATTESVAAADGLIQAAGCSPLDASLVTGPGNVRAEQQQQQQQHDSPVPGRPRPFLLQDHGTPAIPAQQ